MHRRIRTVGHTHGTRHPCRFLLQPRVRKLCPPPGRIVTEHAGHTIPPLPLLPSNVLDPLAPAGSPAELNRP